ncbi:hypothetical protein, partial [Rhodopirellula sp. JC639]|uniref:hypothetical protein n=1 Tax=Stieleria mannarensis TaxID=2755585 RepID=UPI00257027CA
TPALRRLILLVSSFVFFDRLLDAFASIIDFSLTCEVKLELIVVFEAFTLATKKPADQRIEFALFLGQLIAQATVGFGEFFIGRSERLGIFDERLVGGRKRVDAFCERLILRPQFVDLSLQLLQFVHVFRLKKSPNRASANPRRATKKGKFFHRKKLALSVEFWIAIGVTFTRP